MLEQFLHEQLEIAFNYGVPKPEMPSSITQNLKNKPHLLFRINDGPCPDILPIEGDTAIRTPTRSGLGSLTR